MRRLLVLPLVALALCRGLCAGAAHNAYVRVLPTTAALWHMPSYPSGMGHIGGASSHSWRGTQRVSGAARWRALTDHPRHPAHARDCRIG